MRVLMPLLEPILPDKARFVAIVNTSAALARQGAAVSLVLPGPPGAVERYATTHLGLAMPAGLDVVRIAGWHRALGHPFTWNRVTVASALRHVRRSVGGGAVVVHARHERLALALARRNWPLPLVFEIHAISSDYERERGRSSRRATRADATLRGILDRADGVVAISEGLRDEVVRRFGFRGATAVARSGIDLARFPPSWPGHAGAPKEPPRVVYVGRLGAWKAVGSVIAALAKIPEARLVVVGGAAEDVARIRGAARAAGVGDRVDATGFVPQDRVAAILASADVAVHALPAGLSIARRDTSPLKLLEYLAVGVPVVAPDLPSIREIVGDGGTAVLVPPEDEDALAGAIRRVLGDPELRRRLSIAGREVARRHTWDERARILIGFYESILSRRGP